MQVNVLIVRNKLKIFQLTALLIIGITNSALAQASDKHSLKKDEIINGAITAGRNVAVSAGQPGWEHTEYVSDADPSNPNQIMICSMRYSQELNQLTAGVYLTFDGGKTWKLSYNDDSSRFEGVWDPACSFGENGRAHFVTLLTDPKRDRTKEPSLIPYELWGSSKARLMTLYSSADGRGTWVKTAKLSLIDREELKVDLTNGPFRGRIYLYGNTGGPGLWLVYSKDGGKTWSRSAQTFTGELTEISGHGTILPDSSLLLPYSETSIDEKDKKSINYVSVSSSRNGGETLGLPIRVSKRKSGCGGLIAMASDHSTSAFRGRAYIVWGETEPGVCSVMLSYSDDKGITWSSPVSVSDIGTWLRSEASLMPQIVVNKAGVVGVAWYEPIKSQAGTGHWLRFSASLDGGNSWIPSVKVSSHPFLEKSHPDFAAQAQARGGGFLAQKRTDVMNLLVKVAPRSYRPWNSWPGDYAVGLTGSPDNNFHAFWIDNRTGRGEIYTAPITVKGKVGGVGGEALRGLANITSALELQVTSSVWNPVANILSLKYQFQNNSQDVITGPLRIRFLGVESELGPPKLVLTKKIDGPTQYLIDGSDLLPPKGLAPGQTSGTKTLILQYDEVTDLSGGNGNVVASMNVVVYGVRRDKNQ